MRRIETQGSELQKIYRQISYIQRVAYREASQASGNGATGEDGKQGRKDGYQIAQQFKSKRQPSVGDVVWIVEFQVLVHGVLHHLGETILSSVGSNGADAGQSFIEVRENRRLASRVEALELSHRSDKEPLNKHKTHPNSLPRNPAWHLSQNLPEPVRR